MSQSKHILKKVQSYQKTAKTARVKAQNAPPPGGERQFIYIICMYLSPIKSYRLI